MGRALGISHVAVLKWRRVPPLRVHEVEKVRAKLTAEEEEEFLLATIKEGLLA